MIHRFLFFGEHKQKSESSAVLWPLGDLPGVERSKGIFCRNVGNHLKGGMTAFVLCS